MTVFEVPLVFSTINSMNKFNKLTNWCFLKRKTHGHINIFDL